MPYGIEPPWIFRARAPFIPELRAHERAIRRERHTGLPPGNRGPLSYSREFPLEQHLREVIGWQIGDGSEEGMKLIIVRRLFAED